MKKGRACEHARPFFIPVEYAAAAQILRELPAGGDCRFSNDLWTLVMSYGLRD